MADYIGLLNRANGKAERPNLNPTNTAGKVASYNPVF